MKFWIGLAILLVTAISQGQMSPATPPSQTTPPASSNSSPVAGNSANAILSDLDKLQAAANQVAVDLGRMRIEKWKTDNSSKQQAQANADSIQRNITNALPGMINAVRAAPQDLGAQFRLYRNMNALYDVLNSLTESVGAFGPKNEFEALAQQLEVVDSARHNLGDSVETLASSTQSELGQLRTQLRAAQQQATAAAAPPKTTIVDDNEPAKKVTTSHKKKPPAQKPAATPPPPNTNSPNQ